MAIWKPVLDGRPGTRAKALVDAIADDINAGVLKPGDKLPPQRNLAFDLGLSPNTVMRAYNEARRRGYVDGEVGRGTFIRIQTKTESAGQADGLIRSQSNGPIDFSLNLPFAGETGALLADTLRTIAGTQDMASYLDHQDVRTRLRHQGAGAMWMENFGLRATAEATLLANGAQQGIFASLLALLRSGDTLLTEELVYPPVKAIARHLGARIRPVSIDEEGLLPDALECACKATAARVLYCTPTLQTPTAATMSEERRRRIATIAQTHDLTIVEDDVFGLLPMQRPAPLAMYAPERTVFVTSVSKSVAPGLRVGYVHAPPTLTPTIRSVISLSSWMPPPLMAEIASRWIEDGTALRLNEGQRLHAARRQAMAKEVLLGHSFKSDPCGFHLWLTLPDQCSGADVLQTLSRAGVLIQPADTFAIASRELAAMRICLSHENSDERVVAGLRLVQAALSGDSPSGGNFMV